ncbi:MAG: hypothetical protein IJ642_11900 [Oscillospiraceae bacterium]|nr:hypothetical protein [Oscillospiraceae bacterium]
MTAGEIKKKLEENRYSDIPFMTETEFKQKLSDNGYTGRLLELALHTYYQAKEKGYDVTPYFDELYGEVNLFSD